MRLKEINKIQLKLEKETNTRKNMSKRYKRVYNGLHYTSISSTAVGSAVAGVSLAFITNPVTFLPFSIALFSLSGVSMITATLSKIVNKRVRKHEKLHLLGNNLLLKINEILSESLNDSHMNDKEFKKVLQAYQDYLKTGKNIKDTFINRTFVEKEEVKSKIDELFKDNKT